MRRSFLAARFQAPNRVARGAGAAAPLVLTPAGAKDPEKPVRPDVPMVPNQVDIFNYAADLQPLIKSFNDEDLLARTIYLVDPDEAYAEHDKLLFEAKQIDGCSGPTNCVGWGTADTAPLPAASGTVSIADSNKAYQMRRKAFALWVDAVFMEERIKLRGGVTKAQIALEVKLWKDWQDWLKAYKETLANAKTATIVEREDFREMQRKDMQLQIFRNRFREITKLEPIRKYTVPLPPESPVIPWKPIVAVAIAGVAVYALHEARVFSGYFLSPKAA